LGHHDGRAAAAELERKVSGACRRRKAVEPAGLALHRVTPRGVAAGAGDARGPGPQAGHGPGRSTDSRRSAAGSARELRNHAGGLETIQIALRGRYRMSDAPQGLRDRALRPRPYRLQGTNPRSSGQHAEPVIPRRQRAMVSRLSDRDRRVRSLVALLAALDRDAQTTLDGLPSERRGTASLAHVEASASWVVRYARGPFHRVCSLG
jgi:hypothetical protein